MELRPCQVEVYKKAAFWQSLINDTGPGIAKWYGSVSDIRSCIQAEINVSERFENDFGKSKENSPNKRAQRGRQRKFLSLYPYLEHDILDKLLDDINLKESYALGLRSDSPRKRHMALWRYIEPTRASLEAALPNDLIFDMVLDKGFLDYYLLTHDPPLTSDSTTGVDYLQFILDKIADCGKLFLVTLYQSTILRALVKFLLKSKYTTRLYPLRAQGDVDEGFYNPAIFVITKIESNENLPKLEVDYQFQKTGLKPLSSNVYQLFKVSKELRRSIFFDTYVTEYHPGSLHFFEVVRTSISDSKCQYHMSLYDRVLPKFSNMKQRHESLKCLKSTIAVLVPLADQHCWLYKSKHGHQRLAERAGSRRILCVFLPDFGQMVPDSNPKLVVERIKEDIGRHLLELAVDKTQTVLLMTQQEHYADDRRTIFIGASRWAGQLRVFDAVVDEEDEELKDSFDDSENQAVKPAKASKYTRRTMVFECNPRMAQSEVWHCETKKGNTTQLEFEFHHICHAYHLMMISCLTLLTRYADNKSDLKGILLGLGGGILCSAMHSLLGDRLTLDCVELDPIIADVAYEYFGFTSDDKIRLKIDEGCAYTLRESKTHEGENDFIIVDINNTIGDIGTEFYGISCPPMAFLEKNFLSAAKHLLAEHGILIFNVVIHQGVGIERVTRHFKEVFDNVTMMKHSQDLNHVFICRKGPATRDDREVDIDDVKGTLYKMVNVSPNMRKIISRTPMYLGKNASFAPEVRRL